MTESTLVMSFADEEEFRVLDFEFADGVLTIDGDEVPEKGLAYVIAYGLKQALQDSWASHSKAKDYDKASESYEKRLKAIVEGSIEAGTRASNPLAVEVNRLATLAVEKAVRKEFKSRKAYEEAKGKGAFAKGRKGYIAKNRDTLTETAKANLEATAAIVAEVEL